MLTLVNLLFLFPFLLFPTKNVGLLIIDEEQRFGVTHKEKIKQMKKDVDVLTLTATPIPRTLHMSLIGIRDMSVLEEPPQDRMPIQTYVMEYDEEMIRSILIAFLTLPDIKFVVLTETDIFGGEKKKRKKKKKIYDTDVNAYFFTNRVFIHGKKCMSGFQTMSFRKEV